MTDDKLDIDHQFNTDIFWGTNSVIVLSPD